MNTIAPAGMPADLARDAALEQEIAQLIIDTLNLDHLTVDDIPAQQPLFGDGLGLDSVDALELALALQKQFGMRIESNVKESRRHFATIASLASFVQMQRLACDD